MEATVRCLRDCNSHGRCLSGVCACDDGYAGIDCHSSEDQPPTHTHRGPAVAVNPRRRPTPRIYIYDRPPPEDWAIWQSADVLADRRGSAGGLQQPSRWPMATDSIYQAADAFLSRLLRDPEHREYNASAADLYLVPLERAFVRNTYEILASEVIENWLNWLHGAAQLRGPTHRHVWLVSTDCCAAFSSLLGAETLARWMRPHGGIVVCHYALPHRVARLTNGTRGRFIILPGSSPLAGMSGSDVTAWTQPGAVTQAFKAWQNAPAQSRRLQLLFWGSVRMKHGSATNACLKAPRVLNPGCEELYSRGVRQVMWHLFANGASSSAANLGALLDLPKSCSGFLCAWPCDETL